MQNVKSKTSVWVEDSVITMSVSDQRAHVTCVDVSNVNKQIFRRRRKHTPIIAEAQCTYWPIKPAIHSDNQNCTKTVSSCHSRHVTVDGITTYQSLHCWTSTHQPPATFTLPIVTTAGRAHTSLPLHSLCPSQLLLFCNSHPSIVRRSMSLTLQTLF